MQEAALPTVPVILTCDASTQTITKPLVELQSRAQPAPVVPAELAHIKDMITRVDRQLKDLMQDQAQSNRKSRAVGCYHSLDDRFRSIAYCEFKGRGAVGYVYTGIATDGSYCAVKEPNADEKGHRSNGALLRAEAAILRLCIGLPNVAQMLYSRIEGDVCTRLVFPRYHHIDFRHLLRALSGRSASTVLHVTQRYVSSLLLALCGLHARCIVHGDVKPDNFLFNWSISPPQDDLAVPVRVAHAPAPETGILIDFTHSIQLPHVSGLRGTSGWRPQEVARKAVESDCAKAVDLWGVGLLCASLLIGEEVQRQDYSNFRNSKHSVAAEFALCHTLASEKFIRGLLTESWVFASQKDVLEDAIAFVTSLLQGDPRKRPTAEDAATHAFLTKHRFVASCKLCGH